MYEEHPVFTPPDDRDAVIWRYMRMEKFVRLLEDEALYFARADLLGDDHEAALPAPYIEGLREFAGPDLTDERLADIVTTLRRSLYVNCWNLSETENHPLWNTYGKSIVVRSTFGALCDSLIGDETVYIGTVGYIDYDHDDFPDNLGDNGYWPIQFKRREFRSEQELRAVLSMFDENGPRGHAANPPAGIQVSVDLGTLVDAVVVAPGGALEDEARAVVEQAGLNVPVERSSLDRAPRF